MTQFFNSRNRAVRAAMRQALPPDEYLRAACQATLKRVPEAQACIVSFVGARTVRVGVVAGAGSAKEMEGEDVPVARTYCAAIVAINAPVFAPDVDAQPLLADCIVSREEFPGYAGCPIHFRGHVVGVLAATANMVGVLTPGVLDQLACGVAGIEALLRERDE